MIFGDGVGGLHWNSAAEEGAWGVGLKPDLKEPWTSPMTVGALGGAPGGPPYDHPGGTSDDLRTNEKC